VNGQATSESQRTTGGETPNEPRRDDTLLNDYVIPQRHKFAREYSRGQNRDWPRGPGLGWTRTGTWMAR